MSDIGEVMRQAGAFAAIQDKHSGADVITAICDCLEMDKSHRNRVLIAFMNPIRKRIKLSVALEIMGIKDTRTWHKRAKTNPAYAKVELIRESQKSIYVYEDQVLELAKR